MQSTMLVTPTPSLRELESYKCTLESYIFIRLESYIFHCNRTGVGMNTRTVLTA